jgi:hypothetical protein
VTGGQSEDARRVDQGDRVPDTLVAASPGKRRWLRIPLALHLRAVKPGGS